MPLLGPRMKRKGKTMRIVFAALILAAALSVTAVGLFAATDADKDRATHAILGESDGSPLALPAFGGERLSL